MDGKARTTAALMATLLSAGAPACPSSRVPPIAAHRSRWSTTSLSIARLSSRAGYNRASTVNASSLLPPTSPGRTKATERTPVSRGCGC
jgi:hypothetical protein